MTLRLEALTPGKPGFEAAIEDVARLRIAVFREWPYLYDGTLDYERWYMAKLAAAKGAIIVAAFDGERVVGVSTGMPLASEHANLVEPFRAHGFDPDEVFYGAETVMLPDYRGQGLYKRLLEMRRAHARALGGFRWEAFCAVVRLSDHPLRDAKALDLEPVWRRYGYRPVDGLVAKFSWTDIGEKAKSEKPMQFWIREL